MNQPYVLIIDDQRDIAEVTRYVLKRSGFEACATHSPEEGLTLAQTTRPDVVICDVGMAKLSGLEILHALKADTATAHIPVILMSGTGRLSCPGMFTFLSKPFDTTSLLSATRNALANRNRKPRFRSKTSCGLDN